MDENNQTREQLREQNTQLEQKIFELETLMKSREAPKTAPEERIFQTVKPVAPIAPPPVYEFQPAYPQAGYQPYYPRRSQSEGDRVRADALAEAQRILDDARRQADAIYTAAEMSLRSLCDELEGAYSASREKLGEILALYATREKIINDMFSRE